MDVLIGVIVLPALIVFVIVVASAAPQIRRHRPVYRPPPRSTRTRHPKRIAHKWRVK